MGKDRAKVYQAIDSERDYQDRKWGTVADHPHEVGAWLTLMRNKLAQAEAAWSGRRGDEPALAEIVKVVAIGVACLEQHGSGIVRHQTDSSRPSPSGRDFLLDAYISGPHHVERDHRDYDEYRVTLPGGKIEKFHYSGGDYDRDRLRDWLEMWIRQFRA